MRRRTELAVFQNAAAEAEGALQAASGALGEAEARLEAVRAAEAQAKAAAEEDGLVMEEVSGRVAGCVHTGHGGGGGGEGAAKEPPATAQSVSQSAQSGSQTSV